MILIAGSILAVLATLLVLEPVVRPVAAAAIVRPDSDDEDVGPEQRRRDRALAALKEIEFDRATGKLSDPDYEALYRRYAAEAVAALREAGHMLRFCEECGTRLEGSGRFCVECGTRIAA